MSRFCTSCGFPLGASTSFCQQCGKAASGAPAPAAPPPSPGAIPAKSGGGALKIVLILVASLFVLGAVALGLTVYAAHRVKQAVVAKAESYGVDLPSIASAASSSPASRVKTRQQCEWLSKEEASQILGEPIDRAEAKDEMCLYFGPPGLSQSLARQRGSEVVSTAKQQSQSKQNDVAGVMEKMLGAASGATGTDSHGDAPLLMLGVDPQGKPQMIAMEASKAIFNGIPGVGAEVPNLGDRAVRLANLGLNVLKGETFIRIIPGPVPDANEKTVAIARAILPRI